MKKMICYFLACALFLLCLSCCTMADQSTPATPTETTAPLGPSSTVELPFELPVKEPLPTTQREKTGPLVEYDPNRELYILTGHNNIIYYLEEACITHYSFSIISKNPLDVDKMSVDIAIEHPYTVKISEAEMEGIAYSEEGEPPTYCKGNQFPYELYQCYKGKDFQKLAELHWNWKYWIQVMSRCNALLEQEVITQQVQKAYYAQFKTVMQDYQDYLKAELDEYRTLKKTDLPTFYVYTVRIHFREPGAEVSSIPDEVFTEISVTIDDQVYNQQIGQIALVSGKRVVMDQVDWHNDFENADDGILGQSMGPLPYNDGLHYAPNYFHITVNRYKSLTNLVLDNPAHQLEAVWIALKPEGGSWSTYKWDMSEPFELYPGDEVMIGVIYRDDSLESFLGYQTKLDGHLEYESDGKTWYKVCNCYVSESMNYYALYALIFEGIDMESYYWDYYYVFQEDWRFDPEVDPFAGV